MDKLLRLNLSFNYGTAARTVFANVCNGFII